MRNLNISLILVLISFSSCLAQISPIKLNILDLPFDSSSFNQYPEEENKKINVYKEKSPLEYSDQEQNFIDNISEFFDNELVGDIKEQVTNYGFNKFSLGTGAVDVTFQVKNGVKYALKDTIAGYPEYQRRKFTEEILNANLNSHINTENFISGGDENLDLFNLGDLLSDIFFDFTNLGNFFNFKHSNLLLVTENLLNKRVCKDLFGLFQSLAFILLGLFMIMRVFKNINLSILNNDSLSKTIYDGIICFMTIKFMAMILDFIIKMTIVIQAAINSIIGLHFIDLAADYTSLERSWENISNNIGYMPALILSVIDSLAQVFVYFFVIGLIIFIILGKIISPLWALTLVSVNLKESFFENLFKWGQGLFSLTLIPLIFLLVNLLAKEFSDVNNGIFEVVISIISFILLPLSLNIFKTKSLIPAAFSGYATAYEALKTSLEDIKSSSQIYYNDIYKKR